VGESILLVEQLKLNADGRPPFGFREFAKADPDPDELGYRNLGTGNRELKTESH
jgi:hypothetical protein